MASLKPKKRPRDVLIIGGGTAALSAALVLARSRRRVTVIDDRHPRNAPAASVHGLLGNEGNNPSELLTKGRAEAHSYRAKIVTSQVVADHPDDDGYTVTLDNKRQLRGDQLIIATGVSNVLTSIAGLSADGGARSCTAPIVTAGKSATVASASLPPAQPRHTKP